MIDERVMSKIKKCMSLAESQNAHEAAAALRQAQKLMSKHNIRMSDLALDDVNEVTASAKTALKTPPSWVASLRCMIADVFGVSQIWHSECKYGRRWSNKVVYIGVGEKPAAASYCYEVLYRQIARDERAFKKSLRRLTQKSRSRRCQAFCEAWVSAVRSKVEAMVPSERDDALVERYKDLTYGDLQPGSVKPHLAHINAGELQAAQQGYEAGDKANLYQGVPKRQGPESLGAGSA